MSATPVEVHLVDEEQEQTDLSKLLETYNATKQRASSKITSLTDSFTLEGMDSVNELVSSAMKQIKDFTDNGKPKSTMSKVTSRGLALIDPNNKWAGKWLSNATDAIEDEKIKQKTINEIINDLTTQIEAKRQEVIEFIQSAREVKKDMVETISIYEGLLSKTKHVVDHSEELSRDNLDAKFLAGMLITTIENLNSDIKSHVNSLITGAEISVNRIAAILPTIENDLKYKAGWKAFQQKLSDLNGMVKTTTELASNAGDLIREDVNSTIYDSLSMMTDSGLDVNRFKKIQQQELAHQEKINTLLLKTRASVDKTYTEMVDFNVELQAKRETANNLLLDNYSKV